jgi:hypothetical protein
MKKIECQISEEKSEFIDKICEKECYTRAEFNRRALELYISILKDGQSTIAITEFN